MVVLSAVAATVSGALVLVATSRYGPGLTPDSLTYLSTGSNVADGEGYRIYNGRPLVTFPPLYSWAVAVGVDLGLGLGAAARTVNVLAVGATTGLASAWLVAEVRSRALVAVGVGGAVVAWPVFLVATYAWSEGLFVFLALASVLALRWRGRAGLVVATSLAALACLTRYAGVAVVAAGAAALLVDARRPPVRRVVVALASSATALAPLVWWLARNRLLTGTTTGDRTPSADPPWVNAGRALRTVGSWIGSEALPAPLAVVLGALGLGLLAAALLRLRDRSLVPLAALGIAHVVATVALASVTAVDVLGDRLLSPIYLPCLLLAVVALDRLGTGGRRRLVVGLAVLWLAVPLVRTGSRVARARSEGAGGYAVEAWQRSDLVAQLRVRPRPEVIYTNAPAAAWFLLDGQGVRLWPRRHAYRSPQTAVPDVGDLRRAAGDRPRLLVWFERRGTSYFYRPEDLDELGFETDTVVSATDGEALIVGSRPG